MEHSSCVDQQELWSKRLSYTLTYAYLKIQCKSWVLKTSLLLRSESSLMQRISNDRSRAIFDFPSPPVQITESQFDGFDHELYTLAQCPWDSIRDADLWYYLHDLAYVELQPDLFVHLFPACLNFWYHTLLGGTDCAVGDAEFHYALLHGQVLEKMVAPKQQMQIY